ACRNTSRRRRSVMSARTASAPRTRPAALRHGTQCTSSQRGRSSAGRAWRTTNGAGAPPASASRSRAPIAGSPSTGTASSTFRPTALARATPVTRSITAFQAWMVRPGSTTTTASARPSRRLRVVASTRGVSFVTLPYAIGHRALCNNVVMRGALDPSTLVLAGLALALGVVAYAKDPGLPLVGVKNGVAMLTFILPRLVPALILAGLMQVLVPEAVVSRYFGRESGLRRAPRAGSAPARLARPRLARPRDHRDHRPRLEERRRPQRGPPLRARRGLRHAGARQRLRHGGPDGRGARRGPARRAGRAGREAPRPEAARHVCRAAREARHALRPRQGRAATSDAGALPGGGRDHRALARGAARAALLARRRRPLHHAARRLHARSAHRAAQRRHVPAPGVRRAHARLALSDLQGRRRAPPGGGGSRDDGADARRDRARRR